MKTIIKYKPKETPQIEENNFTEKYESNIKDTSSLVRHYLNSDKNPNNKLASGAIAKIKTDNNWVERLNVLHSNKWLELDVPMDNDLDIILYKRDNESKEWIVIEDKLEIHKACKELIHNGL